MNIKNYMKYASKSVKNLVSTVNYTKKKSILESKEKTKL